MTVRRTPTDYLPRPAVPPSWDSSISLQLSDSSGSSNRSVRGFFSIFLRDTSSRSSTVHATAEAIMRSCDLNHAPRFA